MSVFDTMKKRRYRCECGKELTEIRWGKDPLPSCECGKEMPEVYGEQGQSAAVIGDEIDIEIKHGLCNDDGSPRRFRSKAEIRRVAYEKGLTILGETPKPNPRIVEERRARGISR